jgi:ATPase subunit of ABC transporter with duplicated ATPase domains
VLKASGLSRAYDALPLFADVSFVLGDGDRVGLVGPNGAGKTTLLRLLAGRDRPDSGAVATGPDDRVGYLEQQAANADLTVAEHLHRALGEVYDLNREMARLEAELAGPSAGGAALRRYGELQERFDTLDGWGFRTLIADVREHLAIEHLADELSLRDISGGEQARVMLAGVLLARPTVLVLDEPTNHLDLAGLRWLEEYLSGFAGAVLVVSHDRRFLDNTVRRIFELDGVHLELQSYEGGYSAYRDQKRRRWQRLLEEHRAQDRARRQLEADIARAKSRAQSIEDRFRGGPGMDYARSLAKKIARQAKTRERRLTRQMQSAEWIADPRRAPSFTLSLDGVSEPGRRLAALAGVGVALAGRPVLDDVDLVVHGRDRVALVGQNGAGKTTLLRILADELVPDRGTAHTAAATAVLAQDQHERPGERPRLEHFRSCVVGHEDEARALLGHFLFEQEQMRRPLATLSPGERSRLGVAILVSSGAELLLLDEPTNHLDFDSLDVVEEALRQFRGTIVTVSHDRAFIQNIGCDRVLEVAAGSLIDQSLSFSR